MDQPIVAISINWATKVIFVPKIDLTWITGSLYEQDTNAFRLILKALEETEAGMPFLRTHRHNTEVTVAGTTFARTFEIINGFSVEYEDGQYTVRLINSNNNVFDVENGILVQNQVSIIATNSAGLVTSVGGTPLTQQQIRDSMKLAPGVGAPSIGSIDDKVDSTLSELALLKIDLTFLRDIQEGGWTILNNQMIFYKSDNTTEVMRVNLFDKAGTPAEIDVYKRTKV